MKTFFFSFDLNLENELVRELAAKSGLLSQHGMSMQTTSRPFFNLDECQRVMHADIAIRTEQFNLKKLSQVVTSVNEVNPKINNSPEDLAEACKKNGELEDYLDTWNEDEMSRVTYTTENLEDEDTETPPILDEENMIFRYTLHSFDDDFEIPKESFVSLSGSSMIH